MNIDLSGKSALVTGSTEGIGFAIARGLHEAGAQVVLNGRSEAKVDAAVARLGGVARGPHLLPGDPRRTPPPKRPASRGGRGTRPPAGVPPSRGRAAPRPPPP